MIGFGQGPDYDTESDYQRALRENVESRLVLLNPLLDSLMHIDLPDRFIRYEGVYRKYLVCLDAEGCVVTINDFADQPCDSAFSDLVLSTLRNIYECKSIQFMEGKKEKTITYFYLTIGISATKIKLSVA